MVERTQKKELVPRIIQEVIIPVPLRARIEREVGELSEAFTRENNHNVLPGLFLRMMVGKYMNNELFPGALSESDAEEAIEAIHHLEEHTTIDGLTELAGNRRRFTEEMKRVFARLRQQRPECSTERRRGKLENESFTLAIVDIDFFKDVNTYGGHLAGDIALQELVHIMKDVLRPTDSIDRYGGEEFTIRMPATDATGAQQALQRLRKRVQKELFSRVHTQLQQVDVGAAAQFFAYYQSKQPPLRITISAGIAEYRDTPTLDLASHQTPEDLTSDADHALYAAKRGTRNRGQGRDRIEIFRSDVCNIQPRMEPAEQGTLADLHTHYEFLKSEIEPKEIVQAYQVASEDPTIANTTVGKLQRFFSTSTFVEAILTHAPSDMQHIHGALERLQHFARIDDLTQLPNRVAYEEKIQERFELAKRTGKAFSVLSFDIDNFKKSINDACGHPFGDKVLRQLGEIIRTLVRGGEFAARVGGDEFSVLIDTVDRTEVTHAGERFRAAVEKEFANTQVPVTISVGAAIPEMTPTTLHGRSVWEFTNPTELQRQADAAHFFAKEGGKNIVCIYDAPRMSVLLTPPEE
ncbi:MAG: GGDEF domain-containing protein [Candidatus Kerfeldbacteria bacterium]|nr:GGDEF domain-containing protein [Candidatus Kerfeldbacteria bacterium]